MYFGLAFCAKGKYLIERHFDFYPYKPKNASDLSHYLLKSEAFYNTLPVGFSRYSCFSLSTISVSSEDSVTTSVAESSCDSSSWVVLSDTNKSMNSNF